MAMALATGNPLAPRGVGFDCVKLHLVEWRKFRQREKRILRNSSDPRRCMELMRVKAREMLELNFGENKIESEVKEGRKEPVCQENMPLFDEVWQKGNLEEGVDGSSLCLCVPAGHVEDEAIEDGAKADSGMQNQLGAPVCKNHSGFVENLGYLPAVGGSEPLIHSQGRIVAVKEGVQVAADKGNKLSFLQGHHGKESDQGRSHIKDQDVKVYVLYKTPPWHIPALSEMQKINPIFERKEDLANIQKSVRAHIPMFGKDITHSVDRSGKNILQKRSSMLADSDIGTTEFDSILGKRWAADQEKVVREMSQQLPLVFYCEQAVQFQLFNIDIWVQIQDLPIGFVGLLNLLASKVGEVIYVEPASQDLGNLKMAGSGAEYRRKQ